MKTNTLIYKAERSNSKITVVVTIKLADECKNGHEDFSVTASVYHYGEPQTERNMLCCGCCHDEVLTLFPEFKPFVDLHLSNFKGIPMYAVANGFYHLKETPDKWAGYYGMTPEEAKAFELCEDKDRYRYLLVSLGIIERWNRLAAIAIHKLETLTGKEFEPTGNKVEEIALSPEFIELMKDREKSGYYSQKAILKRNNDRLNEIALSKLDKAKQAEKEEIAKIKAKYRIKNAFLKIGVDDEHYIYYGHTNTIKFNWRGYGKTMPKEDIERALMLVNKRQLTKGVKFEF